MDANWIYRSKNGQVAVLLVLTMVVLLGFTALAIDGGRLYSDRRHAQNAADAAALAGALQKANNQPNNIVLQVLQTSAAGNGYHVPQVAGNISGPYYDIYGKYFLVSSTITSTIQATFAQFIYNGPLQNKVTAVARVYISQPAMPGYAIIAMGDCTTEGGSQTSLSGGGNNGAIETYLGGIFLNAPENASNQCAIDTSTSTLSVGIVAHDGARIASVGSVDYNGVPKVSPNPIDTGINFGERIQDPLEELPEPVCTSNGSVSGGNYQPGRYGGPGQPNLGGGHYEPGIYCVSGDVHLSGSEVIEGDGVVLYFIDGGLNFTGNAGMRITAPTAANCLGSTGSPSASCTYKGIAVFLARNNFSTFEVRGNGGDAIHGLIYGLNATIQARGGGVDPDETTVVGQIIARRVYGDGNGSFIVTFNENETFIKEPVISLDK